MRGVFNRLFATATPRLQVVYDGNLHPHLLPTGDGFVVKNIFTDFKRHDLGPAFHEREYDVTLRTQFLTTPLWGVGTSAPCGHDGPSINLEEVTRRHGGEAQVSRNAFARLDEPARREVLDFLGTIDPGELFQITEEGPE